MAFDSIYLLFGFELKTLIIAEATQREREKKGVLDKQTEISLSLSELPHSGIEEPIVGDADQIKVVTPLFVPDRSVLHP